MSQIQFSHRVVSARLKLAGTLSACLVLTACGGSSDWQHEEFTASQSDFDFAIPDTIPEPFVPEDNPMSEAKVRLGRHLFYDNRLSGNQTQSCASCHEQALGFADGVALPTGSTGEQLARNSQGLLNVAYNSTFTWSNHSLTTLSDQHMVPLFAEFPVELGINDLNREEILLRLSNDPDYQSMFAQAWPDSADAINFSNISQALASFIRSMVSFNSDFDRYERGDTSALTASQQRGRALFFDEKTECFHCHGGFNFSQSTLHSGTVFFEAPFFNNGLYNLDGNGSYPEGNQGLYELTGKEEDKGKFRPVSLRNIEVTAPYMHDGSISTLAEVIEFYAAGGRAPTTVNGVPTGDGRKNPNKSGFVGGFTLTEQEKQDLLNFLKSLTDHRFNSDERFSNPYE
ncbi:methanobactin export MATE transporter MbnM [Oceanospirillum sediminis]|uniref:methanobactin export MATE transporter MbnM n=1 Tax=Oceanospirillum sediminis TaxID=2760088 RepID=UPI001C7214DE|nr:methanobactin export MATE transporter MbnM [Oceanospirillum sediminis]